MLYAAMPASPLDTEFTVQGSETLGLNESFTVNSNGILNIGGGEQDGSVDMSYNEKITLITNNGVINIGNESNVGKLTITGSYSGSLDYAAQLVKGTGTWNIAKNSELEFKGAGFYKWNSFIYLQSANVYGKVTYTTTLGEGYLTFNNLNLYQGGSISSAKRIQVLSQGVWNLYSANITAPEFRFTGTNSVVNINCANALSQVGIITMDLPSNTGKIVIGNYDNKLGKLAFVNNSKLTIDLADNKNVAFSIGGFQTKENTTLNVNATLVLQDFVNDFVLIENTSNFTFVDNKLSITGKDSFITIEGYYDGNLIEGDWYLKLDEATGKYFLNNTAAIPEPSTVAAILGIAVLGYITRRRRR